MRKLFWWVVLAGVSGAAAGADIEPIARTCNGCHGLNGVSVGESMPSIGGLPKDYLARIMKQWKYGERNALTMDRIVKGYSDDQLDALAEYFSKQVWTPVPQPVAASTLAKGKQAVLDDCQDCHGQTGNDPDVGAPKLNGQWAKYMELELMKYRSNEFKMPHRKMRQAAREAKAEEGVAAARYFSAQGK